jgi:hypothetical protein
MPEAAAIIFEGDGVGWPLADERLWRELALGCAHAVTLLGTLGCGPAKCFMVENPPAGIAVLAGRELPARPYAEMAKNA